MLVSTIQQSESAIHIHIPVFGFPSHLGDHSTLRFPELYKVLKTSVVADLQGVNSAVQQSDSVIFVLSCFSRV